MIIKAEEIIGIPEFASFTVEQLQQKLDTLEVMIRSYSNNNFQNKNIRFLADSVGTILNGSSPFLKVGDTIQVSESRVNDGLYVVTDINPDTVVVDKPLFPVDHNLVTKIQYPLDVVQGVINMLKWQVTLGDKVGIASETISRHSVTYFNQDAQNQVMGFPVSLLGFLQPYMKARF